MEEDLRGQLARAEAEVKAKTVQITRLQASAQVDMIPKFSGPSVDQLKTLQNTVDSSRSEIQELRRAKTSLQREVQQAKAFAEASVVRYNEVESDRDVRSRLEGELHTEMASSNLEAHDAQILAERYRSECDELEARSRVKIGRQEDQVKSLETRLGQLNAELRSEQRTGRRWNRESPEPQAGGATASGGG